MPKIWSLGTSNRSIEEFLEILKFYHIEVVADVRRWPTSKLFLHFKKENLEKILKENGIDYYHFEKLGGYRENGYENYAKTLDFKESLNKLIEISRSKNLAILCAERFPWKCHRSILAQKLENLGFKVIHIIEKNKIWEPKLEPREIKPTCQRVKIIEKIEKNEK